MAKRHAPGDEETGTHRLCIVTRAVMPVNEMLRFVAAPDGALAVDLKHALPGRGAWLSARAASVREAVRRKAFARALKAEVAVPADLDTQIEGLLRRRAIEALAIANKAGAVVAGFAKIEEALRRERVVGLLHAREGSPDGIAKLDRVARQTRPGVSIFTVLGGDELDLALGRANVIHAALLAGGASAPVLERCHFLARYRETETGPARRRDRSPDALKQEPAGPTAA